jgi:hypothetical protein
MRIRCEICAQKNVYVCFIERHFLPNVIKIAQESKHATDIWIKRYPLKVQTFPTIWHIVVQNLLLSSKLWPI